MEKHTNNNFSHGFFMGAVLGAGAMFFLGTEKGKKLLKIITEEGIQGWDEMSKVWDDQLGDTHRKMSSEPVQQEDEKEGRALVARSRRFFKRKLKK